MKKRTIAFDFDGVLCDGLAEYFYSSCLTYQSVWQFTLPIDRLDSIRQPFYDLRPVIETGWEMVILVHALLQNTDPTTIENNWQSIIESILTERGLTPGQLMVALDQVRDRQITENLNHWLSLHRFYDGVVNGLQALIGDPETTVYIITTKEARFTEQLLRNNGVHLPTEYIFGKEKKQSKIKTLYQLYSPGLEQFWFIEDRLQTLENVRQESALNSLQLFLASWGYNNVIDSPALVKKNIEFVDLDLWEIRVRQFLRD